MRDPRRVIEALQHQSDTSAQERCARILLPPLSKPDMWRVMAMIAAAMRVSTLRTRTHTIKPTKQGSREDQDQILNEAQLVVAIAIANAWYASSHRPVSRQCSLDRTRERDTKRYNCCVITNYLQLIPFAYQSIALMVYLRY